MKPLLLLSLLGLTVAASAQTQPSTKKVEKVFTEHGGRRIDNYYWLSDPKDSNVINHLKEENAYTKAYMKNTEALQKKMYDELVGRIDQRFTSLPGKSGSYWYYIRYDEGQQYPYYARKKGSMASKEEIILNGPMLAKGYKIWLNRGMAMSSDNSMVAYGIDTSGDRKSTLFFKNMNTGKLSDETVTNTSGDYAWARDNRTMYYVLNDPTVRAYKVMRHVVGSDTSTDKEIYTERDSTYGVGLQTSPRGEYIFILSYSTETSEARYLDAKNPTADPVLIQARQKGVLYSPAYYEGDNFYITTNKDALNFKVVSAPIISPSIQNWTDLIPHKENVLLNDAVFLKNYYVVQTKENGLNQIRIYDRKKKQWRSVEFGQDSYVANMSVATDDYNSDSIRYNFTSMITPPTDYQYNLATGAKKQLKQVKVAGYDPSLYLTKRIWIKATDGTSVPVSIAYRKDKFRQDGKNPLFLYAYGSYGNSMEPYFSGSIVSLLDRGVTYAIAHIRGGQDLGRAWYEAGKMMTKKNTFTDFTDVAQALVDQKYTSADRMFANGGSAGGMLMGAVINLRPDLFRGVIAEVPWMDVITDMFDTNLPLTTLEYNEWGDPNVKEQYDYMISWSPMDNVKKANYPSIFATGGLNDTQVPYYSPAKWVAKVRENNLGNNPVLLQINMGAGHGGESGRFERQKLQAQKYAFILEQIGWNENTRTFNFKRTF